MKNSYLLSLVVATILFTGCGDTSSSTTDVQPETSSTTDDSVIETSSSTTFTVERGPILGATLADANGTVARELGHGQYIFDQAVEYPVISTGGYIDVNRNGTIDAGEVENTLHLETTEGNVVTLATTLSSNAEIKTFLVDDLGIDEVAIANRVPGNDQTIEALSDTVFRYALENDINNTSELSQDDLTQIQEDYTARYETYLQDGLEAAEHETDLINSMSIVTLDDAQAEAAETELRQRDTTDENPTTHTDQTEQSESTDNETTHDGSDNEQTESNEPSDNEVAHSQSNDDEQSTPSGSVEGESSHDETDDNDQTTQDDASDNEATHTETDDDGQTAQDESTNNDATHSEVDDSEQMDQDNATSNESTHDETNDNDQTTQNDTSDNEVADSETNDEAQTTQNESTDSETSHSESNDDEEVDSDESDDDENSDDETNTDSNTDII